MDRQVHERLLGLYRDQDQVDFVASDGVSYTFEAGTASAGELVRLLVVVSDGCIREAIFQAYGCGYTLGILSLFCTWLRGRSLSEVDTWTPECITVLLEVPNHKRHTLILVHELVAQITVLDDHS